MGFKVPLSITGLDHMEVGVRLRSFVIPIRRMSALKTGMPTQISSFVSMGMTRPSKNARTLSGGATNGRQGKK